MYSVSVLRRAARDISRLPRQYPRLALQHIEGLALNPRPVGSKALGGRTDRTLRAGVYRILYRIDDGREESWLPACCTVASPIGDSEPMATLDYVVTG